MRFNEPAAKVGSEVLFHDPARKDPRTLRRAVIAGKASDGIGYHLLVYNDPEIDCKYGGMEPTSMAFNVDLIEGPEKMPSPVARCAWRSGPPGIDNEIVSSPITPPPATEALPTPDPDIRAEYEAGLLAMPEGVAGGTPFIAQGSCGWCLIACMNGNDTKFLRHLDDNRLTEWVGDVKDATIFIDHKHANATLAKQPPPAFIAPIVPSKRGKSTNLRKSR